MSDLVIPTFDRSTLERWATCPQQAWLIDRSRTNVGEIAVVGQEIHDAISRAIQNWIDARGLLGLQDVVNALETELLSSRADVQTEVFDAMRKSLWSFCRFLTSDHYLNIMRFDGGEGDQSGQLSHEYEGLGCRVTAELDLLMASPAKQEVDVYDWKSGWKHWTSRAVKNSFQFQMQSLLVFENYPDVECVRVTIWNLRENRQTYSVEFFRRDMMALETRVRSAAGLAIHHGRSQMTPPGWPTVEKCELCSVAVKCNVGDEIDQEIETNAEAWVDRLVALNQRSEAITKSLSKVVAARSAEIETASGNCFGFLKPKRSLKPKPAFYSKSTSAIAVDSEKTE